MVTAAALGQPLGGELAEQRGAREVDAQEPLEPRRILRERVLGAEERRR